MKIFVSWAGARSQKLASALQNWLPTVLPNLELFHSEDIQKGEQWHQSLIQALRGSDAGIFCITPESMRSQWMLFEAGAISQIGTSPRLFTYLYGTSEVGGPLGHFQATRFTRDSTGQLIRTLASVSGENDLGPVANRFEDSWEDFEAKVLELRLLPIQSLLPGFPALFENKKTFHEPFPDCSDKRWEDRVHRIAKTVELLSTPEYADVMSSDTYLSGAYENLMGSLDRYKMHIGSYLLKRLDFSRLTDLEKRQLESTRQRIVDIVRGLQKASDPPVFAESFKFESETSTPERKDMIHKMQIKLDAGQFDPTDVRRAGTSVNWGLDRIVFYLAVGGHKLTGISLPELTRLVQIEEDQARTRELVQGLQPLYYSLECLDEIVDGPVDAATNRRLLELSDDIDHFIRAHDGRDTGGHIERRVNSLRHKLTPGASHDSDA